MLGPFLYFQKAEGAKRALIICTILARGKGKLSLSRWNRINTYVKIFKNSFLTTANITPNGAIQLKWTQWKPGEFK